LIDSVRRGRVADDVRRRLQIEPLVLEDADLVEVEESAAEADLMARLREALPADQLAAFTARVFDERGYEDIARELETSPSVVRKRVSRAAAQLRSIREERA
jgi:RNA polymerase sigma-70 factor (ECF subfamily)